MNEVPGLLASLASGEVPTHMNAARATVSWASTRDALLPSDRGARRANLVALLQHLLLLVRAEGTPGSFRGDLASSSHLGSCRLLLLGLLPRASCRGSLLGLVRLSLSLGCSRSGSSCRCSLGSLNDGHDLGQARAVLLRCLVRRVLLNSEERSVDLGLVPSRHVGRVDQLLVHVVVEDLSSKVRISIGKELTGSESRSERASHASRGELRPKSARSFHPFHLGKHLLIVARDGTLALCMGSVGKPKRVQIPPLLRLNAEELVTDELPDSSVVCRQYEVVEVVRVVVQILHVQRLLFRQRIHHQLDMGTAHDTLGTFAVRSASPVNVTHASEELVKESFEANIARARR